MSLSAATETVREWFGDQPAADVLSLAEIYQNAGRDPSNKDLNKSWLGNKLTHLKHYGLVAPIYSHGRRKVLDKIQLTGEGKKAIWGSNGGPGEAPVIQPRAISLETIARDINEFEEQNPSIRLELLVRIKKNREEAMIRHGIHRE